MADSTTRDRIIAEARARLGIPYALPPSPPTSTDCSLYVLDVFKAAGVPFSAGVRTAEQERQDTVPIAFADVLPGDLVYFENTYDAGPPSADGHIASHIGISLGAGTFRMLNAVEPVSTETDISTPYWQEHIFEARRHPALVGATAQPPTAEVWGVDVASHQGAVDWRAVKAAGALFSFTKSSGGAWYTNPTLAANWDGMKANGIKRGAYHFAFESSGSPGGNAEAEADFFVATMLHAGGFEPGDMAVLDIEDGGAAATGQWALQWCRRVEQLVGFPPVVYTGAWVSGPHGFGSVPELSKYPLWLAAYQTTMPAPVAPWTTVAFWQHTDKASVPGVSGPCDRNLFNGPAEHLALYGKGGNAAGGGDPLDPWRGVVGSGILDMMEQDGTVPIMASTWLPLGRGQADAEAEEGYGENGIRYLWHLPSGRNWRYPAA